jgi:uncharacterized membrane protein (DUF4010 family)
MTDLMTVLRIAVAALGGAAVGLERQWSGHATGPHARFGGIRTFALLGGIAGAAGHLITLGLSAAATVLVAGSVALVIAGYVVASRHDVDATTEAAALVVIGAGVLAGVGWMALASGVIAVTTLLLVEKSRLHALVRRIDDEELRAATRFGVMAIVILPLLPEGPFGPLGGIRPRELWLLVLFFTGLSFTGYLARRILGATHGYPLAGLFAGLISSSNATFTYARLSRKERSLSRPLAIGTIAACTMLFPRVLVATSVLDLAVARELWPYLVAPFAVGAGAVAVWLSRSHAVTRAPEQTSANPLQIGPALQMALTFQLVMLGVDLARRTAGDVGLMVSGAILGVTDVDALTVSMARSPAGGASAHVAAQAIAVGILTNSTFKLTLAAVLGSPAFRRIGTVTLAGMAVVTALSISALW